MTRIVLIAALVVALAALSAGIAIAAGSRDDDTPITGSALVRASAAALDFTGGGRVTGTEVGDEEGYYEVEVKRADGSQIDVHLDRNFDVLDGAADTEAPDDQDGPSDD